jgi:hypothetical protein
LICFLWVLSDSKSKYSKTHQDHHRSRVGSREQVVVDLWRWCDGGGGEHAMVDLGRRVGVDVDGAMVVVASIDGWQRWEIRGSRCGGWVNGSHKSVAGGGASIGGRRRCEHRWPAGGLAAIKMGLGLGNGLGWKKMNLMKMNDLLNILQNHSMYYFVVFNISPLVFFIFHFYFFT